MGERWNPGSVFVVKYVSDVLNVMESRKKVPLGEIDIIIWSIDHSRAISDKMW